MRIEKILPTHFFSTEQEKIRLNWFACEIALEIQLYISKSMIKTLKKYGYNQSRINSSCIKLAQLL